MIDIVSERNAHVRQSIAFLGTGIMGAPMCEQLLDHGYTVRVWNRSSEKSLPLAAKGATVCATPVDAVADAQLIVFMLSTGPVVDSVLFDPDLSGKSVADYIEPGADVVVMSSIPVETSRRQAQQLAERGIGYVDAPVSGGEKGAREASLTIMAGGDLTAIKSSRSVLEVMGRLTHVGPPGSGQLAKLANQTIVGITISAISEALLLAEAGGADPVAVRNALMGGFADSTVLRQHGERILERKFTPGAKAEIQLKDLRTSRELADSLGLDLPVLRLTESLYRDMCRHGYGSLDHSALYLELAGRSQL